jgi:hypothetical protein
MDDIPRNLPDKPTRFMDQFRVFIKFFVGGCPQCFVVKRNLSINSQKTALNALVFMFKQFLHIEVGVLSFIPSSTHSNTRSKRVRLYY